MSPSAPRTALLGHTGFVGSNLAVQHPFSECFNSQNFRTLAGRHFDLVVCSAVAAVKWQANRDPAADWARIEPLLKVLATVRATRFVLISTIDVYPLPKNVDESVDPRPLPNHAYGTHRSRVESFVCGQFPSHHIVRLPGLFGPGLKKNVIFDLLHDNGLDAINPAGSFQYYDLARLWADLENVIALELPLLNLATEPISTATILSRFFPEKTVGSKAGPAASYDFRSQHAARWGGTGGYLYSAATVLDDLGRYVASARA